MDYQEKTLEFGKLVARARKAGLVRADYADHGIVILQLKPKPPDAEPPRQIPAIQNPGTLTRPPTRSQQ